MTDIVKKMAINKRVAALYDRLMNEGRHGHYETLFHIVHAERKEAADEIERLRNLLAATNRDLEKALAALDHHLKADR